jgi:hypothetical protein
MEASASAASRASAGTPAFAPPNSANDPATNRFAPAATAASMRFRVPSMRSRLVGSSSRALSGRLRQRGQLVDDVRRLRGDDDAAKRVGVERVGDGRRRAERAQHSAFAAERVSAVT